LLRGRGIKIYEWGMAAGPHFRSRLNKVDFRVNITGIVGDLDGNWAAGRLLARRARVQGAVSAGLVGGGWGAGVGS